MDQILIILDAIHINMVVNIIVLNLGFAYAQQEFFVSKEIK